MITNKWSSIVELGYSVQFENRTKNFKLSNQTKPQTISITIIYMIVLITIIHRYIHKCNTFNCTFFFKFLNVQH